MQYPPCLNPSCKSYGKSHPHCNCYGNNEVAAASFAKGGCIGEHQENCEHFATGKEVSDNQEMMSNPDLTVDHTVAQHGLLRTMTHTGTSRSADDNRPVQDFVEHARKGRAKAHEHVNTHFEKAKTPREDGNLEPLKKHLNHLHENPGAILNVGGNLGHAMPEHVAALTAKTTAAAMYLKSIKPSGEQAGPMDRVMRPDKQAVLNYDRQMQIAEQPLSILPRIKNGTVQPQDMVTLVTLYPQLAQSLKSKAFEKVVDAQTTGKAIPYKQKLGLSHLLNMPLDSTMTPQAMQAIIMSAPAPQPPQAKKGGATAQTQKTIDKADAMEATPLQSRQINKKQ